MAGECAADASRTAIAVMIPLVVISFMVFSFLFLVLAALCREGAGHWQILEKRGASLTHSLFRPRPSGLAGKHARTRDCSRAEADFLH